MLDYREITLKDREWMDELFRIVDYRAEEYSFSFTYIWRNVFGFTAARLGDFLIIKADRLADVPAYLFPVGRGNLKSVVNKLGNEAQTNGIDFLITPVTVEGKNFLETEYPGRFSFEPLVSYFDYIYDTQSLITLAGKKLHAKRNHINRFIEAYPDWSYETITVENLHEVLLMNDEWLKQNMSSESPKTLIEESGAVSSAIKDFIALGLDGGLIRAGGRVVAFSMGDRLNSDTYLVQIEKAYGDIQGAYAMINREFARHCCEGYKYIDREDDSGDEGLRRAKRSYYPAFLAEKFAARMSGWGM